MSQEVPDDGSCALCTTSGERSTEVLRRQQYADLQARKRLLLVLLTQDVADALIALQDIAGVSLCPPLFYGMMYWQRQRKCSSQRVLVWDDALFRGNFLTRAWSLMI
jgi:hypothetical protein